MAVCLDSSLWFGSCIHNSPCQYKSHCRRPAFACSPSHRSLSTEKRGGQEMTFQTFPMAATISSHPPYQVCPPVGAAECASYLSVEAFISGHSRFYQTLPKLGLPQAGTSKPFFLWGSQRRIWIPMCHQTHPFCASKTVPQTHDMWRGKGPTANMWAAFSEGSVDRFPGDLRIPSHSVSYPPWCSACAHPPFPGFLLSSPLLYVFWTPSHLLAFFSF